MVHENSANGKNVFSDGYIKSQKNTLTSIILEPIEYYIIFVLVSNGYLRDSLENRINVRENMKVLKPSKNTH